MLKSKRIQKRQEMLPGRSRETELGARNWEFESLQMAWNVGARGPNLKSMACIQNQALRQHAARTDSRNMIPDLVRAGLPR